MVDVTAEEKNICSGCGLDIQPGEWKYLDSPTQHMPTLCRDLLRGRCAALERENAELTDDCNGLSLEKQRLELELDTLKQANSNLLQRNLVLSGKQSHEPSGCRIADGWSLYACDFSLQASGNSYVGSVTLVRDLANKVRWHMQSDEIKESDSGPPLYVYGKGKTIIEAIGNANVAALSAIPLETGEQSDSNHVCGFCESPCEATGIRTCCKAGAESDRRRLVSSECVCCGQPSNKCDCNASNTGGDR